MTTPTPLQRLSEIVEAGTSHPASSLIADTTTKQAFIFASMAVTRFLASPEAVEVLARAICRAWIYCDLDTPDGRMYWQQYKAKCLAQATAVLNTIAEQALKEPSNG